jgi:hypothetical protein
LLQTPPFKPVIMGHIRGHGCNDLLIYAVQADASAEVIGPSPPAPNGLGSSGSDELPYRHQGKYAAKCGQSDKLLVCEQGVAHDLFLVILD